MALCWLIAAQRVLAADVASPLSPEQSFERFVVEPGLVVELVACEPQIVDPVAIRFDEEGRLWVVEMRDYPNGPPAGSPPRSRISILDDRDGDGRFETATVFADHLLFPTGLQPWRGGAIVTLSGKVVYLKDTDADGQADVHEVWFQGFAEENPQLRANHPRLALDNLVYVANGLRGGAVVDPRMPGQRPLSISGMDFCFDPMGARAEAVSGNGQFGMAFDDFGNRFICNNRAPLEHVVLENRYLARNPFLAVGTALSSVAASGEQSHVFPLTRAWTTSNLHAGQFTAACGVEIYRGGLLGSQYEGNAFVCEPTGSLVHREIVSPNEVSFVSRPARDGQEFLASPDAWFRPVNLELGPDGALYVVDMYRAVIEHPQFMPSELQHRPDLRLGDDRGRVYRVVPAGVPRERSRPRLSQATSVELAALLRHKNAWWRETAARLLLQRQDQAARGPLEALVGSAPEATARVRALWALAGQNALSSSTLQQAAVDEHPRVREQAVLLAEARLADDALLRQAVMRLAGDADSRVRFRAALALGGLDNNSADGLLAQIVLRGHGDAWTRRAVETAAGGHNAAVLIEVLNSGTVRMARPLDPVLLLVQELAAAVGARGEAATTIRLLALLGRLTEKDRASDAAMLGLCEGLARKGQSIQELTRQPAALQATVERVFRRAQFTAEDASRSNNERLQAIALLRFAAEKRFSDTLVQLVARDPAQTMRIRAAAALEAYKNPEVAAALLRDYAAQTPSVRQAILGALVSQPTSAEQLLAALETGTVSRTELGAPREHALRQHANPAIRARAQKLLAVSVPAERGRVLAEYRTALSIEGDPKAGKQLFVRHCATCHRIGDLGVNVAPDISDSRVKTAEQLLVDILIPNQAIDNNYVSYTVVMTAGTVHTGIIAGETASTLRLRQPEDKTIDLLRSEIESLRSNGVSLMPEGFEKQLSQHEVADVIAFIKNWRYLDEPVPATIAPPKQ